MIGMDRVSGSDRPQCRSIMFRTGSEAGGYQNLEAKFQTIVQELPGYIAVEYRFDRSFDNRYKTVFLWLSWFSL